MKLEFTTEKSKMFLKKHRKTLNLDMSTTELVGYPHMALLDSPRCY